MQPPTAISFAPDGSLLVTYDDNTQPGGGLLYRVDPTTGNRTIISSAASNTGPSSTYIGAVQVGGTILMSGGPIVSVDPATGNRTLVSDTGQGTGPAPNSQGFAVSGTNLFVASTNAGILNVDTTTGNRTVISSATVGTGPSMNLPVDVALGAGGNLIVNNLVELGSTTLLGVDPASGNRTLISGGGVGTGPGLGDYPGQLGIAANATIYTNQITVSLGQTPVLAIDPATGNRTIVSDATHGSGPLFDPSFALAVVPTPEPSTMILAVVGGLALLRGAGGDRAAFSLVSCCAAVNHSWFINEAE